MIYAAAIFFLLALIAAVFGFTDIAPASAEHAKIIFIAAIVLFVGTTISHALRRGP